MSDDKLKFQYSGLNWLLEHQLLDDPQIMNHLALNVLSISKSIINVEFLLSRDHRQLLIYLELSWLGRTFNKDKLFEETQLILSQMLPTFKLRVINDPKIFKMALDKVKKALTGGSNESSTKLSAGAHTNMLSSGSGNSETPAQSTTLQTNSEQQSKDQQESGGEIIGSNSSKGNKV